MVTYLGGSILITIFALGGSIVSYNLHAKLVLYKQLLEAVIFTFNTLVILKLQGLRVFLCLIFCGVNFISDNKKYK